MNETLLLYMLRTKVKSLLPICLCLTVFTFVNFITLNDLYPGDKTESANSGFKVVEHLDNHPEYDVELKCADNSLKAGEEVEIEIDINYGASYGRGKAAGEAIKNLQVVYNRIVQVFVVSENLQYFDHIRPGDFAEITPEIRKSSLFKIKQTFPWGGKYRLVACFSHRGQIIYKHFDIKVEGKPQSAIDNGTFPPQTNPDSGYFDGFNVGLNISPFPLTAKRKSQFTYHIKDDKGVDVNGLEVFTGTEMHLVSWSEDLEYFEYSRTKLSEGDPGSIMIVPPIKTEMRYGTGILREIKKNGKILIEHGKVGDLLPAGQYPFKVSDPEVDIKVEVGDWVEFWVVNNKEEGIVIRRIEPLATVPTGEEKGVYEWAGNLPIYPGPDVPVEHSFPREGRYMVFSQFKFKGKVCSTRFPVEVNGASPAKVSIDPDEVDDNKGMVKLSSSEFNGQRIYKTAASISGKPIFLKQDNGSKIDAAITGITCIGCHGEDGRGGQEGGILSSDIRYSYLTKPYGVTHTSGRKHPPYDDKLIKLSITEGIDPAGNKLDPSMVRWEMNDTDLNDLVSYIHRLSEMGKPGISDKTIRIGCVLDISGPLATTGLAAKEIIEAAFKKINEGGKIYGRSLKLIVADGGNSEAKSLDAAKLLVENENIFCFIGNLGEAAMKNVAPYLDEHKIPLIVPLAPTYQPDSLMLQNSFFLFPTIEYQAKVIIDYIMGTKVYKSSKPKVAVICANDTFGLNGYRAAKEQLVLYGISSLDKIDFDSRNIDVKKIAASLAETEANNVLIFTPDPRVISIVAETDRLGYSPKYFCNNMLVMKDILNIPKASERFLIVQNFSFAGRDNTNCAEFLDISKQIPSRPRNLMIQMAAFTGVKVLEEGLRLSGRDLTRKLFIKGMEGVELNSGLFGIVKYSPGDHRGVTGIFLVKPDPSVHNFVPATRWLRPTRNGSLF